MSYTKRVNTDAKNSEKRNKHVLSWIAMDIIRIYCTLLFVSLFGIEPLAAQSNGASDPALFDFWVGEWTLTWIDADGNEQKGTNYIEKILDEQVLQEHFADSNGKFKGTSISVFNPNRKSWHQAWADNQGGYYNFVGAVDDGRPVFQTKPIEVNDKTIVQRMVFYDIKANSFTWDWEKTVDGGESWELLWRIWYQRKH